MTAEELLNDIDHCCGPCGDMCLSCPESHYLNEIRDVIVSLMEERDMYKSMVEAAESSRR